MKPRTMQKFAATAWLSLLAASACGMTINPNGTGQVLIFPYYTVNKSQQTLVTVSNPTAVAKSLEVVFREGYNGKVVYSIAVFLAPHQSWATGVFALSDVNTPGNAVGISTNIDVCNQPLVSEPSGQTNPGPTYDLFSNQNFTGANADGGPTDDSREREGFIEVFELSEIQGATAAAVWPNLQTENCQPLFGTPAVSDFTAPTGGVVGGVSVIDVPQGTFFSFEPKAIDGFRAQPLLPLTPVALDNAGDETTDTVSASVNFDGRFVTATFSRAQAIDAVSALFMATSISGEVDETAAIGANTDWVLTFPTKQFYVNSSQSVGVDPFNFPFGAADNPLGVGSYVPTYYGVYSHEGISLNSCGFSACPPSPPFVQTQTQIISFAQQTGIASAVLGSALVTSAIAPTGPTNALLYFNGALDSSNEGFVFRGVPVFGVQAINYVNSNVTAGVLSNYSGTARLRTSVTCEMLGGGDCP